MNPPSVPRTWNRTSVQNLVRHKSGKYYARVFANGKETWQQGDRIKIAIADLRDTSSVNPRFIRAAGDGEMFQQRKSAGIRPEAVRHSRRHPPNTPMCCFSKNVTSVSSTKIFARLLPNKRQALIYSMLLDTPDDVAMILPIPVAAGSGEDAVEFHALDAYPEVFTHLEALFPKRPIATRESMPAAGGEPKSKPLKVVEVGSFNASFVPTVKDFGRLDEQFRLPDAVWSKIGAYSKYGFAVFKLRKGNSKVHPMAFDFPTALEGKLFFPTVHIHDGAVHARAEFDHILYAQPGHDRGVDIHQWEESEALASREVSIQRAKGLVAGSAHVYKRRMFGKLKNEDVIVAAA